MLSRGTNFSKVPDTNLIDKVLEQGQRLRNSIVKSILNNDPFNSDILLAKSMPNSAKNIIANFQNQEQNVINYLKGDPMSPEEKQSVLNVIQNMSPNELCKTTERTFGSYNKSCNCYICNLYETENLSCDLQRSTTYSNKSDCVVPPIDLMQKVNENNVNYNAQNEKLLKHVDSMQVTVHSLELNSAGIQKLLCDNSDRKLNLSSMNCSYFVEYCVQEDVLKFDRNLKSFNKNCARICSKKASDKNIICFKQSCVFDLKCFLPDAQIKFTVSCRTIRQKGINVLGVAKFCFTSALLAKNLSCSLKLAVFLKDESAINVGFLKVCVKFGCGRIYFGKEFVNAVFDDEQNNIVDDFSDSSDRETDRKCVKKSEKKVLEKSNIAKSVRPVGKKSKFSELLTIGNKSKFSGLSTIPGNNFKEIPEGDKQLLYGLLYVSQAQFNNEVTSYFTCRPFCIEETLQSKIISDTSNPLFNFYQVIPLIYEDEFLSHMRDNFIIVEFWEKTDRKSTSLGICKLLLHQFYLSYRNPVIVKYLLKNKFPVINTDWWEPITEDICNNTSVGQTQILLALGSEEQIRNLEIDRGFKKHRVTSVFQKPTESKANFFDKTTQINLNKTLTSVDIGVQSDLENLESNKMENNVSNLHQKGLESFLTELLTLKHKNLSVDNSTNTDECLEENSRPKEKNLKVENSTNTDECLQENSRKIVAEETNLHLRKTSELLDSLHKALNYNPDSEILNADVFNAHIVIENAMHLPVRKKCKSKKSKAKNYKKNEDTLPITYVILETGEKDSFPQITNAVKGTNPRWDFQCDVTLSSDLLTDNQKCLLFKIWRKSNVTNQNPCPQTDIVLGMAAVDLTVLLAGLPFINGWFNIIDYTGKCNGQIKIQVTPLESLHKFSILKQTPTFEPIHSLPATNCDSFQSHNHQTILDNPDESLSRALKRKFTELDEITQRLRLRLSDVTKNEFETSNDNFADEFERDINTLCVEDDYETVNLQMETDSFNNRVEDEVGLLKLQKGDVVKGDLRERGDDCQNDDVLLLDVLEGLSKQTRSDFDKQMLEGKQRIDNLLEKLTLLPTTEPKPSTTKNLQNVDVLTQLESLESHAQINTESLFDPQMFRQIYLDDSSKSDKSSQIIEINDSSSSNLSFLGEFSERRKAPDGAGNISEGSVNRDANVE